MPFTVITLKKVPDSLRGDLTRWMQEIATGVYVGSYNSRIREYLWKRVTDSVGAGEATLCYSCRNEIGYSFATYNTERQVVDFDGIPLVLIPEKNNLQDNPIEKSQGFSKASKYHQAHRKLNISNVSESGFVNDYNEDSLPLTDTEKREKADLVFLDIETTGLDPDVDQIIEIGAIKVSDGKKTEFHRLIRGDILIPDAICNLTGITDDMLRNGTVLETSICDLYEFIQDALLIGYNIGFDLRFINRALVQFSMEPIHNKTLELMYEAKKRNSFQVNFKFETTLKEYGINKSVPHRALEDAKLVYQLYNHMGIE